MSRPVSLCAERERALGAGRARRVGLGAVRRVAVVAGAVREVGAIGLTVGNLDRRVGVLHEGSAVEKLFESKSTPRATDELLGLSGTQLRSAELKLGDERITLTEHLTKQGAAHPVGLA